VTEIVCIVCPKGCHLKIDENNGFQVSGNDCEKGDEYGKKELINPERVITSTVVIKGASHRRCPVKTSGVIPKSMIMTAMKTLNDVVLTSPVYIGQTVVKNIEGIGIDFVVTRNM